MINKKTFSFYLISSLSWMSLIFLTSSVSDFSPVVGAGNEPSYFTSSVAHILLYAILCFLWLKVFITYGFNKKKSIALGFLIAVLYGLTDELHQYFTPNREPHVSDWLFDVVGAFITVNFYRIRGYKS